RTVCNSRGPARANSALPSSPATKTDRSGRPESFPVAADLQIAVPPPPCPARAAHSGIAPPSAGNLPRECAPLPRDRAPYSSPCVRHRRAVQSRRNNLHATNTPVPIRRPDNSQKSLRTRFAPNRSCLLYLLAVQSPVPEQSAAAPLFLLSA